MGWHLHARTHAGGEGDTAVRPVRTHCSTTALCQKGIAAGCRPGFSSQNEDLFLLSALHGARRTLDVMEPREQNPRD